MSEQAEAWNASSIVKVESRKIKTDGGHSCRKNIFRVAGDDAGRTKGRQKPELKKSSTRRWENAIRNGQPKLK
jgi:hypothetical protein